MKIKIGDLKEGTIAGVLLKSGDVPWKLPQNVPFHCIGSIIDKLNGRYRIWVSQNLGTFTVEQYKIKPLPFDHPFSQMCLVNRWEAYIQMNPWTYIKHVIKRLTEKIKYSNIFSLFFRAHKEIYRGLSSVKL